MKVFLVAGARPNFMKIAPIFRASLRHNEMQVQIVHTGQHYDHDMSQLFFDELEIPPPSFNLQAGSGSHAVQTAKIMMAIFTRFLSQPFSQTSQRATPIRAKSVVQTGAKSQLGGANSGLTKPAYQVGMAGAVKNEPTIPANSQTTIAKISLKVS